MRKCLKTLLAIFNLMMPTIVFYWIYTIRGVIAAVVISFLYNGISLGMQYRKKRTVSNTSVIGLLGLICSGAAIYFTGNEKFYYIPALVVNLVTFVFLLVLSLNRKSVLHYLAKDFEIKGIEQLPQEDLWLVNILWLIFFGMKIITKVIGIIYLDFEKLYWLVFLMGDPAMLLVIVISVVIIRAQFVHKREN